MFMNDYTHKGGIRIYALNYLSHLGLPSEHVLEDHYVKLTTNQWNTAKIKFTADDDRYPVTIFNAKIFNVPLAKLHKKQVELKTGQKLKIPKIVLELCEVILQNVETEGIFQENGSRNKQGKIKMRIEQRGHLSNGNLNVVDVAAVLRYFLRTLPEPLIPYSHHKLFLACCNLKHKKDVLLIATLLLPTEHLNLLTYLMQFFNEVTTYCQFNKMCCHKLSVCIARDIIPVSSFSPGIFDKAAEVVRQLITKSYDIGFVSTDIQQKLEAQGRIYLDRDNMVMTVWGGFKKFFCLMA